VIWDSRFVGRLMIVMAPNGHFFGQIPHPMHRFSDMKAIFEVGSTSMHSRPLRTTGQDFLHSCLHFCKWLSISRMSDAVQWDSYLWFALRKASVC